MNESTSHPPASYQVLGVRVDAVQIPDVVERMAEWIASGRRGEYVAVTGMHGVMEAQKNGRFKEILNGASLVVPDGMPLVWMGKVQHHPMKRRVYGPELLETFCAQTGDRFSHYFYGGAPGVAARLGEVLRERFGIRVAGSYCPPFRPLNAREEQALCEEIQSVQPDVLWVGLSTPKQEAWMATYRRRLPVPVLVGVGAAFDFHTGKTRQAPEWMREHGFEWFFRLATEPRRLWHRYIVQGSQFVFKIALQLSGLKHYS